MSEKKVEEIATKVAKSNNQYWAVRDLLRNGYIDFRSYCRSQAYYASYRTSFFNMLGRLQKTGIDFTFHTGKRGGMWSSYVTLN